MPRLTLAVLAALALSACSPTEATPEGQELGAVESAMTAVAQAAQDAIDYAAANPSPANCFAALRKLQLVPIGDPDYQRLSDYWKATCKPAPTDGGT